MVALLHDVLDDTDVTYGELEARFGRDVAEMVKKVSRLSALNQLLRRNRRHRAEATSVVRFSPDFLSWASECLQAPFLQGKG